MPVESFIMGSFIVQSFLALSLLWSLQTFSIEVGTACVLVDGFSPPRYYQTNYQHGEINFYQQLQKLTLSGKLRPFYASPTSVNEEIHTSTKSQPKKLTIDTLNESELTNRRRSQSPRGGPDYNKRNYTRRRKNGNVRRNSNDFAAQSRSILNSFEQACHNRNGRERVVEVLNSMVQNLLDGRDLNAYSPGNILSNDDGKQDRKSQEQTPKIESIPKNDLVLTKQNISKKILPKDASSIIRLLGRHGAHDAMLQFCRRFCQDLVDSITTSPLSFKPASQPSASLTTSSTTSNMTGKTKKIENIKQSILYAYTAAIAACSNPTNRSSYRNISFLHSLLDEMENEYCESSCGAIESIRPNSFTLSAILLGADGGSEALDILDEFEEKYGESLDGDNSDEGSDAVVTVEVYNAAIAACSRISKESKNIGSMHNDEWQMAFSILNRMGGFGPDPNEHTYFSVLHACAKCGQLKVALALLEEIRASPTIDVTSKLFLPLLKACANVGDTRMAQNLIRDMKRASMEISIEHINLFLVALAKSRMHLQAMKVLEDLINGELTEYARLSPDLFTFNTVLLACANAGDSESARNLLQNMKDGLYRFLVPDQRRLPDKRRYPMKEILIRPDVVSYNTVISCADPETALNLIHEMRLNSQNGGSIIRPNAVTYTNAIARCRQEISISDDPYIRNNFLDIALEILDLARDTTTSNGGKNVELNVFVYSAAIWAAEECGNYEVACSILRDIQCSPNNVCYNGVISALGQHGLHSEALGFFYEMMKLGIPANWQTYEKVSYAINNSRDTELSEFPQRKAALLEGVMSSMQENDRRVEIGGPVFASLIRAHGQSDSKVSGASFRSARKVFNSIVGPVDDACLSAMLFVCSSVVPARWEDAVNLLHCSDISGGSRGPGMVTSRALSYAVIACAKGDRWDEALNLIDLYGDEARHSTNSHESSIVSIAAMNAIISACGRTFRPDLAVQILNDMSSKYGVTPDARSYRIAIMIANQAEHREAKLRKQNLELTSEDSGLSLTWWECALSLLRRMIEEDGLEPDSQTYSSVVSACEAAGQWQRAIGVLQSMPSFSNLIGTDSVVSEEASDPPNLYCLNAAISACEKGGAWVEALQLYEHIKSFKDQKDAVQPNFVTVNSLLIALDNANQIELADAIYEEAVRENIVSPWKIRTDADGTPRKMMDLHQFSAPTAKIAVRSYMEALLLPEKEGIIDDAIFIVGKGKGSDSGEPVLMPTILQLLRGDFGVDAEVDETNNGRIRVPKSSLEDFIQRKRWLM